MTDEAVSQVLSGWYDQSAEIPYRRGKKTKSLDVRHLLKGCSHRVMPDGRIWLELNTRCDNEGSLRPEIIVAALDQALRGLEPGVDEEIVSTGIQKLMTISSYNVERCSQRIRIETRVRSTRWAMSLRHQRGALRRVAQRRLCRTCEYAGKTLY